MDPKTQPQRERRIIPISLGKLELRDASGGGKMLTGYAAVFDQPSEDLGGFTEYVRAGCFARALRENQDVRALINHDPNLLLGRSTSGTLRMREDQTGLLVECELGDQSYVRDLQISMSRKDITGMSFSFSTVSDRWTQVGEGQGEAIVRDLTDVDLFDVSVVTFPAYPQTEAALRSLADFRGAGEQSRKVVVHPLHDPAVARIAAEMGA